ncbi:TetR family transcriptional regulator [Mangrovihabitans endophyticus]|uniref:TetR family transcriptional regulator n=1 Tax=Mangrovihabitans endophyticus TaxID=1751298 RepID=A0A8J3BZK8_9ACTN|nr:TetR family transcriptional regulator [Mangrovihabitans endophyticus]GGK97866.1 TetR family transcriptional regulator [Mangrovihabitans endophyticus]
MSGLRERKKAETRRSLQEHALRLFAEKGYDATTVEEIAAAAGVSHMTFFRYFPSKPAVVENDDYDPMLAAAIRSRPPDEAPLTAIRHALVAALRAMPAGELSTVLARSRLIVREPTLRARQSEAQRATRQMFAESLAGRGALSDFERQVVAGAALAALTMAIEEWVRVDGRQELADLVECAMTSLTRE